MKGVSPIILSPGLLGLAVCAYLAAGIGFLFSLASPNPESNTYLITPYSIQAGMIANTCGAIVAWGLAGVLFVLVGG